MVTGNAVGADRIPPHNLDAEMSVIGACMLSPTAIDAAAEVVGYGDFYREAHKTIYKAITGLHDKGFSVDAISVAEALGDNLPGSGGKAYLLEILNTCPSVVNAAEYCRIVRKLSIAREVIRAGAQMQILGYDAGSDVESLVSESMNMVMGIAMANTTNAVPIGSVMSDVYKELAAGKVDFITPPGLSYVHLKPGDLLIVAAGTSVGKTAVTMDWVDYWSGGDKRGPARACVYFEYEMSEVSLASRLVAKYSGITMNDMDEGLSPEQMDKVRTAGKIIQSRRLSVENVYGDIHSLIAKVRRAAQFGAEIVVIDHLGLIPFRIPDGMNHAKAVGSEVTNRLKRIASELNIRIVLLCQLNRAGQEAGWKAYPNNMNLRDSGEIEQDASHIVMLYRYPKPDKDPASAIRIREELNLPETYAPDIMHIGVTKNRNGGLGGSHFGFDGATFTLTPIGGGPVATHSAPAIWNEEEKVEQNTLC